MITKPTLPQLAIPCKQCGQPVPIKNDTALRFAKLKGITCKDCQDGPKWTKETYNAYLQSEEWRIFRVKVFQHYERKCYLCNGRDDIEVHHNTYERLGRELLSDVIPLCRKHHQLYEDNK